jgi:HEXXH motif-containing protein
MRPDLMTFARNLCWTPALLDCCRVWLDACAALLDRRFRAYCEGNAKLARLLGAYLKLPEGLRRDFLLSPSVSGQLLVRDAGHVPSFAALAADFVRVLGRSSAGAASDPDLAAFGRDQGELRGIPLDLDSTFSLPPRGPGSGEPRALRPERAAQARQCLGAVLDALGQGNPTALEYVRLVTRRLVVREEEGRARDSASCIFSQLIGLTLFTNPWAERADGAHLVDALVHESIHGGLFFYEAVHGSLFLSHNGGNPIPSPWTGKLLSCDQLVQACFVWFALAHLWGQWPAGSGGVPGERATQLYRRASQDFRARPVQALWNHPGGCLVSPPVRDALHLVEQLAIDAWGPQAVLP